MKSIQVMLWRIVKVLGFAAAAGFLFWKCQFGYGNVDEVFYLCLPYRLWQGDALLVHEWSLQQFSAVPMFPLVSLYMWVFNATDGMILHFRYLFTAIMVVTALFHYRKWCRYHDFGAFVGALMFMMSAPFGIMALSYNSMGVIFFSITVTALAVDDGRQWWRNFYAGFFYGLAVLACPFLVLAYALFILVCWRKRIWIELISFTVGGSLVAVALLAFVFSRASMADVVAAVPNFFTDPAHMNKGILIVLRDWIGHFLLVQKGWSFSVLAAIGAVALWRMLKCRYGGRVVESVDRACCTFYVSAAIVMGVIVLLVRPWVDFFALPICVAAVACSLLSVSERARRIAIYGVVPAFIIGFCTCLGTNQGSYCVASVMFVSIVPAIVVLYLAWRELNCSCTAFIIPLPVLLSVVLVAGEAIVRYRMVWEDGWAMNALSCRMERGPQKGIITRKSQAAEYLSQYESFLAIRDVNPGSMALMHICYEYMWLCLPHRMGSYSSWVALEPPYHLRLMDYWRMHNDRIPLVVCIPTGDRYAPFVQVLRNDFGLVHERSLKGAVLYWK